MTKVLAWLQASRLASQTYIFFPLLLGQGFYRQIGGELNPAVFCWVGAYSLLIQLFIVYANDYADAEVDRLNTTYNIFSGGSRVLVCGLLSKKELQIGVAVTMALNAGVGCVLSFFYERSWVLPLIFVSWALLWIYSYTPFKLSYRGGGEVVQALGVGFLLLFFGYYAQAGNASHFPWQYLVFVLPLQLGAAFCTALPDEPSDREGRKHTLVVLVGPVPVKLLVVFLYFTGLGFFCFIGWPGPGSLKTYLLVAYPFLATILMALLIKDGPAGHWRCNAFVALAVSSVVATMATLAGDLLLCRSEGQRLFG